MIPGIRTGFWALAAGVTVLLLIAMITNFERPPIEGIQRGYRGLGMQTIFNPRTLAAQVPANQLPAAIDPVEASGTPSSAVYQNVKVLGNVDSSEFIRLMTAITAWVSPQQGCAYCHNTNNMAEDSVYTKVVARRMLQMVQHINGNWKNHVAATGVTCWTCHRGQPVPAKVWYDDPGPQHFGGGLAESFSGKNLASAVAGYASLPYDPFTPFLEQNARIRVQGSTALPEGNRSSIKQTDWTYSLMMNFSQSLGVNCTYCHNSRSFQAWDQSSPQRTSAWYGIRMVRDANNNYLDPLKSVFPPYRHGPLGDVAKVNCATCHQGVYKPLFGASMIKDYPELASSTESAAAMPAPAAQPTSTPEEPAKP